MAKQEPLNRAVAADENRLSQERAARHLSGHAAAIDLEDDLVPCELAQVIGVRFAPVTDAQFPGRKSQLGQKFFAFSAVQIEDGHGLEAILANFSGEQQRRKMVARRDVPFAGANKDAALLNRRNGEFPLLVFERIRRWDESDGANIAFGSGAAKNLSGFRGCSNASVSLCYNSHKSRKLSRIA